VLYGDTYVHTKRLHLYLFDQGQVIRQAREYYLLDKGQVSVCHCVKPLPNMQPGLAGKPSGKLPQNVGMLTSLVHHLPCAGVSRDSNSSLTPASYSGGLPVDEKRKMAAPEARNVAPMTSASAAAASEAAPALDAAAAPAASKMAKGPSLRQRLQVSVVCTKHYHGFWLFCCMHSLLTCA